jgi:arylsulfatase A-like enzyme
VTGLDTAIGRLLATLEELGLSENTLIFFSSDNGPEDYRIGNAANAGVGSPGVFRARKRSIYEGGVRTPCVAYWPGKVPGARVDEQSVMTGVDWLPTVCGLAGVKPPDINGDGEDVSDMLLGKPRPRKMPIFWEWRFGVAGGGAYKPPRLAVRDGNWKLFVEPDGSGAELYDIPADPREASNLAAKHPEVVRKLSGKLLAWKKTLPK